jgi:hypothetical protein
MRRLVLVVGFLLFAAPLATPVHAQAMVEYGMISKKKKFKPIKFPKTKMKAKGTKSKSFKAKPGKSKSFKSKPLKSKKFKSGSFKSSSFRVRRVMDPGNGSIRGTVVAASNVVAPQSPMGPIHPQVQWVSVSS